MNWLEEVTTAQQEMKLEIQRAALDYEAKLHQAQLNFQQRLIELQGPKPVQAEIPLPDYVDAEE